MISLFYLELVYRLALSRCSRMTRLFFSERRNPCLNYMCQKLVVLKQIFILIFTDVWIVLKPFRHFVYHLLNKCTRKTEAIVFASSIICIDILTLLA